MYCEYIEKENKKLDLYIDGEFVMTFETYKDMEIEIEYIADEYCEDYIIRESEDGKIHYH